MAPDHVVDEVRADIEHAFELMRIDQAEDACALFHRCRTFASRHGLDADVDRHFETLLQTVHAERDKFRSYIRMGNPVDAERRIVVLSDSLGAPRPGQPLNVFQGLPTSYAFALRETGKRRVMSDQAAPVAVDALCQRYATSCEALDMLDLVELNGSDLVVHVGLNDFSVRIFQDRERLSMKLLPQDLVSRLLHFAGANRYRFQLTDLYNSHRYVSFEAWQANIRQVIDRARSGGARSLTWLTLVPLPSDVEATTAHYRYNVMRYALALHEAARTDPFLQLLDLGQMAWEDGFHRFMLDDRMHLSQRAHVLIANRLTEKIFGLPSYTALEQKLEA